METVRLGAVGAEAGRMWRWRGWESLGKSSNAGNILELGGSLLAGGAAWQPAQGRGRGEAALRAPLFVGVKPREGPEGVAVSSGERRVDQQRSPVARALLCGRLAVQSPGLIAHALLEL